MPTPYSWFDGVKFFAVNVRRLPRIRSDIIQYAKYWNDEDAWFYAFPVIAHCYGVPTTESCAHVYQHCLFDPSGDVTHVSSDLIKTCAQMYAMVQHVMVNKLSQLSTVYKCNKIISYHKLLLRPFPSKPDYSTFKNNCATPCMTTFHNRNFGLSPLCPDIPFVYSKDVRACCHCAHQLSKRDGACLRPVTKSRVWVPYAHLELYLDKKVIDTVFANLQGKRFGHVLYGHIMQPTTATKGIQPILEKYRWYKSLGTLWPLIALKRVSKDRVAEMTACLSSSDAMIVRKSHRKKLNAITLIQEDSGFLEKGFLVSDQRSILSPPLTHLAQFSARHPNYIGLAPLFMFQAVSEFRRHLFASSFARSIALYIQCDTPVYFFLTRNVPEQQRTQMTRDIAEICPTRLRKNVPTSRIVCIDDTTPFSIPDPSHVDVIWGSYSYTSSVFFVSLVARICFGAGIKHKVILVPKFHMSTSDHDQETQMKEACAFKDNKMRNITTATPCINTIKFKQILVLF